MTRDEPLRVGAQIIADTRDGVAPATSECLQADASHLGCTLGVLVESLGLPCNFLKFSGGRSGAKGTHPDAIAVHLFGQRLGKQ